ncbi:hypothetical protein V2J09_023838 [Rumex salicifolius]
MFGLGMALVTAASAAIFLFILIVGWCYYISKRGTKVSEATIPTTQNKRIMEGIQSQRIIKIQRQSYNLFRRGLTSTKPLFCWADHPSLITDAVENGWSRFAFTNNSSISPSTTRSSLLSLVGDLHNQRETQVEITWEVGEESVELMQKIKMNSGLKKFSLNSSSSSTTSAKSVIKTALPLPGPSLGNPSSFPQEAYFEITVCSVLSSPEEKFRAEGEKTKLIEVGNGNLDALDHEIKLGEKTPVMISVGLTSSCLVPLKIPGTYHGSIGFHSDGSVHLDGTKLGDESEKEEWGQEEKVIGCGYDPRQKKVFFTVDSKLVHVINCKTEEFGSPLYPIIAANAEITIVVNMGQSGFLYGPANGLRTPNPCFSSPLMRSPGALGFEDSGELFSMGRIDSGWHHHCSAESSINGGVCSCGSKVNEDDDESDADLFEIVLDINGKSADV